MLFDRGVTQAADARRPEVSLKTARYRYPVWGAGVAATLAVARRRGRTSRLTTEQLALGERALPEGRKFPDSAATSALHCTAGRDRERKPDRDQPSPGRRLADPFNMAWSLRRTNSCAKRRSPGEVKRNSVLEDLEPWIVQSSSCGDLKNGETGRSDE
jgi:hypothetical protein